VIRVILVDDERLIRESVKTLLEMEDDIEVVGTAADGAEALHLARKVKPDVAVLDLQMPELDGIEVAEKMIQEKLETRSVIVTSHGLPGVLSSAMKSGVTGFVPKDVPVSTLVEAIRKAARGVNYVDPTIAAEALQLGDNPLTEREQEMLRMVLQGATPEQIAKTLHLAESTVGNHLWRAAGKLSSSNRHEAAHFACSVGWI